MTSGNSTTKRVLVIGRLPPPYGGIATVIDSIVNSELRRDYSFEMFNRSESVYDPWTSSFSSENHQGQEGLEFIQETFGPADMTSYIFMGQHQVFWVIH